MFDLRFDCGANAGFLREPDNSGLQSVWVEHLSGNLQKPSNGQIIVPEGHHVVVLNQSGTILGRVAPSGPLLLVLPNSVAYLRQSTTHFQIARGDHKATIIAWPGAATPLLEAWLSGRSAPKNDRGAVRVAGCKPVNPHFFEAIGRFERALRDRGAAGEILIASVVYEIVARIMSGRDEVQLAATPSDLPETILELVEKVRKAPNQPWPLREAADLAGYSPFHFSRIFKSMVGYGFHEYVDRCRTESAVLMLVSTDDPIDIIAQRAGFGTTQGLRESVKEYLGLVPSELRAMPTAIDI